MIYTETTTQKVTFDEVDVLNWAKTFAARQMGIDVANLNDENVQITKGINSDILITITCTKESSNKKEET